MNVNSRIFGEGGNRIAIPMFMYRLKEFVLPWLGGLMNLYGISKVELDIGTHNFLPAITLKFEPVDDSAFPDILAAERNEQLQIIKQIMARYGLNSVHVELTQPEIKKLREYWSYLVNGAATPETVPVHLPVPTAQDPTNKIVIPDAASVKEDVGNPPLLQGLGVLVE